MKLVIRIFTSLLTWIVGLLLFALMLISLIIMSYLMERHKWDPIFKSMMRFLFRILLIPVKVSGTEHIKPQQAYIFMPNHVSLLDIPLAAGFIPVLIRGVEAHTHFKWPLYGFATRRYGNIPINRQKIGRSLDSLHQLKKYLETNNSVIIFPESTRTLDGKMQKFKKLPFLIAKEMNVEIIPVAIKGMFELNKKGTLLVYWRTIELKFGAPVSLEVISNNTPAQLAAITRQKVAELLV